MNAHKPSWKRDTRAALSFIAIAMYAIGTLQGVTLAAPPLILQHVNNARRQQGLHPLESDDRLSRSARQKADDICTKGYWSHTAPDGTTGWTLMQRAGYAYSDAGENIAKNFRNDQNLVDGWMASPGHRANILKTTFIDIGIGESTCVLEGAQTTVVVAHFGKKTKQSIPKTSKPAQTSLKGPVAAQQDVASRRHTAAIIKPTGLQSHACDARLETYPDFTKLVLAILDTKLLCYTP